MWRRVYCDPWREWNPSLLRPTDGVEEVALSADSLAKTPFCHPELVSGSCLFLVLLDAELSSA